MSTQREHLKVLDDTRTQTRGDRGPTQVFFWSGNGMSSKEIYEIAFTLNHLSIRDKRLSQTSQSKINDKCYISEFLEGTAALFGSGSPVYSSAQWLEHSGSSINVC